MSNVLYRCKLKNSKISDNIRINIKNNNNEILHDEPNDVLLRFYGPAHSDTEKQLEVFRKLADENLGPKLYAEFEGGRFEEYLPSCPLTRNQMLSDHVSCVIAKKLASIHQLDLVSCLGKNTNWLIDQYKEYYGFLINIRNNDVPSFQNCSESTKKLAFTMIHEIDYNNEILYLSNLFKQSKAPLVFSHNDLHQNNIVMLENDSLEPSVTHDANNQNVKNNVIFQNDDHHHRLDDSLIDENSSLDCDNDDHLGINDRIVLIDFEYCSYNFRTFDMANHLSEWCFDYNAQEYPYFKCFKESFPSIERQRQFLKHYVEQLLTIMVIDEDHDKRLSSINNCNEQNDSNQIIESLVEEMQPFLMGSNFLWTLWAIKSACTSKIKFGYWVS